MDKITLSEFHNLMSKIYLAFDQKYYSEDRMKIIWSEAKQFFKSDVNDVIMTLISDKRSTPTINDFRSQFSLVREKISERVRLKQKKEAEAFFKSSYVPEDKQWIAKTIINRLNGQISDQKYKDFQNTLKKIADESEGLIQNLCEFCHSTGIVMATKHVDQNLYAFRCECKRLDDARMYPRWNRNYLSDFTIH